VKETTKEAVDEFKNATKNAMDKAEKLKDDAADAIDDAKEEVKKTVDQTKHGVDQYVWFCLAHLTGLLKYFSRPKLITLSPSLLSI
jgi:ElaB/YqjD/DUF883 family membrane-anchored ribosome-binding protein